MGVIGNTIEVGKTMFEALQAENTRLRDDIKMQREDLKELKAEARALQAENAALKRDAARLERMLDKVIDEGPMGLLRFDPRDR